MLVEISAKSLEYTVAVAAFEVLNNNNARETDPAVLEDLGIATDAEAVLRQMECAEQVATILGKQRMSAARIAFTAKREELGLV